MRHLILILLLATAGCATQPRILVPAPALSEVFRGGTIQGLEDNTGQYIGAPGSYDRIEHTCTSYPAYDLHGRYIKTIVKCW